MSKVSHLLYSNLFSVGRSVISQECWGTNIVNLFIVTFALQSLYILYTISLKLYALVQARRQVPPREETTSALHNTPNDIILPTPAHLLEYHRPTPLSSSLRQRYDLREKKQQKCPPRKRVAQSQPQAQQAPRTRAGLVQGQRLRSRWTPDLVPLLLGILSTLVVFVIREQPQISSQRKLSSLPDDVATTTTTTTSPRAGPAVPLIPINALSVLCYPDLYAILLLPHPPPSYLRNNTALTHSVRRACRQRAVILHPDKLPRGYDDDLYRLPWAITNLACMVLADEAKRETWDLNPLQGTTRVTVGTTGINYTTWVNMIRELEVWLKRWERTERKEEGKREDDGSGWDRYWGQGRE